MSNERLLALVAAVGVGAAAASNITGVPRVSGIVIGMLLAAGPPVVTQGNWLWPC